MSESESESESAPHPEMRIDLLPELRSSEWSWVPTGECFKMTDVACVFEVLRVPDNIRGVAKLIQERKGGNYAKVAKLWQSVADIPNVARLMDFGETSYRGKRAFFMISELVDRIGVVDVKEAARIGLGILNALESLHARGISHNDVGIWSIGITTDNLPVLSSFKIANKMGRVFFSHRPLFPAYRTTYESKPYHDVQSLLYTLIYLLDGNKLPWTVEDDHEYGTDHKMAMRMRILDHYTSPGAIRGLAEASLELVDAENPYEIARRELQRESDLS